MLRTISLLSLLNRATASPTGATGTNGFPLADIHDQQSPTYVVLDTLSTIASDVSSYQLQSWESATSLCNSTISQLEAQVLADSTITKTKHEALVVDVNRITTTEQLVDSLETKLTMAKHSARRANRTLFDLQQIRLTQRTYFQSHTNFLNEVHTDVQRLHEFLDAPPGHLSKNNRPNNDATGGATNEAATGGAEDSVDVAAAAAATTAPPTTLLDVSNVLQQQQHVHMEQSRRLRHSQQALLRSSSSTEPHSIRVTDITDITPEPPSFHTTFHASLDELQSFLSNATMEHTTSQEESHLEYDQAFTTLNTEAALQRGKLNQLKILLQKARAEHQAAITTMDHLKESTTDMSKEFLAKHVEASLSSLKRQCALMEKGQEMRQKHRQEDVKLSKSTKKLMMDIVNEMNGVMTMFEDETGSGEGETGGATGGDATGATSGDASGGAF